MGVVRIVEFGFWARRTGCRLGGGLKCWMSKWLGCGLDCRGWFQG